MKILKKLFKFILRPYLYITLSNFLYSLIYRKRKKLILTKDIKYSSGALPVLCFAGKAPKPNEIASGGRVKLIELSKTYPEKESEFNIIYLVSSALPEHFEEWIIKAKSIGAKIVVNQNGVLYKACFGSGYSVANLKNKHVLKSADYVIYQSQFCKDTADKFVFRTNAPNCILYNAIDTNTFVPGVRNFDAKNPILLLGGNQYDFDRYEIALETISILKKSIPNIKLLVTGILNWDKDFTKTELISKGLLSELKIEENVEFTGSYLFQDAPAILNRADIMIHTKYNDPCPGAVIEAMSCGLPVVYSNTGGTPELVGTEAGIGIDSVTSYDKIYPPNPEKMAEAVLKICKNYESYSKAARQRAVEKFDIQYWLDKHKEIFNFILK